jgi:hypothetical protein
MSQYRFQSVALVFAASLIALSTVQANNLSFLKDTPMANFNDEDIRLMTQSAADALADAKTPSSREWENTATNHSGTAKTLKAFEGPKGIACKRLRLTTHSGNRDGKSAYTLCNMGEDGWKIVPNDYAPMPKTPTATPAPTPTLK